MHHTFGIETEYGITVEHTPDLDVVHESIAIVRSYTEHGAHMKWDYANEDPHADARGFRAAELRQDTDEAAFYELDSLRNLTHAEIKSDLVLSNGARFYNDHAHPEYSTPECTTLPQLIAQDKAGERILEECLRRRNTHLPPPKTCRIYKNNTDFQGHSYGCHDNFLIPRATPWERIVRDTISFLTTRQIFAGAGKVGIESEENPTHTGTYQLTQRSDFFEVLTSIDTMNRRPLVNTRDEPHADPSLYRRFHIIIGDANMSEWATAMKVGTTALALELISQDKAPRIPLADPIHAIKHISRDPTYQWHISRAGGGTCTALDIQNEWLNAARQHCNPTPDATWVLHEWATILHDLATDPLNTHDRCDWAAKRHLLETFRQAENLDWSHPWLQSLDLEYHNISRETGLYYELLRTGHMRRIVNEQEIHHALFHPPETTRAYFRGRAIAKFDTQITSLRWDEITFGKGDTAFSIPLPHPAHPETITHLNEKITHAKTIDDLR